MRLINELIWHCTATPEGREVSLAEIDRWHKERGWTGIGYHKVVHLDGSVGEGRPESQVGAHVAGRNQNTIGYVYVGGMSKDMKTAKDTRTPAQKATMLRLTREAVAKYKLKMVSGHRDYAAKACPSFDARKEYSALLAGKPKLPEPLPKDIGMPEKDPQASVNAKGTRGATSGALGIASLAENAPVLASQFDQADSHFSAGTVIGTIVGVLLLAYAVYQIDGWLGHPVRNWLSARVNSIRARA